MAARKQLFHPDDVKAKIQTSQLINRLTEHALSELPIMDASQVNAAKILIGKVLPDVKAVEHSGELNLRHSLTDMSDEELAAIAVGKA
jgi:hypothetical protein